MIVHPTPQDLEKIIQVKHILEKDFRYHYTQQQLAFKVCTNESKLRQVFKSVVNMTIYEYLTRVRVQMAKDLLENSALPIKMIADRVGYDVRTMNRVFKKKMGMSPLGWRKKREEIITQ